MPKSESLVIGPATAADIDGILEVQEQNQPEHGGSLSARFSSDWFLQMIEQRAFLVARRDGQVAGYVAFTPREAQAHVPIIQALLGAGPHPLAYVHGPICVGRDFRRQGVASALFRAQREVMNHAPVCAFIREDNDASRQAHRGMGMSETAVFEHDGVMYVMVESVQE